MFRIPLVDLKSQYSTLKSEIDSAIQDVLNSSAFVMGEAVGTFERSFAAYCGAAHCIGCANGTDALSLALEGLGIGDNDEVITTAHTFIATAEAISSVGARPVFVDIADDTLLLDPKCVEAAITGRTKAIIAVHLYGQMCDMAALTAVAKRNNLYLLEDAAQAHGAQRGKFRAGSSGDASTFSFYPGKNLGAFGDAGAVTTSNGELANWIAKARNHGRASKYEHDFEGRNSRLDTLQAAILSVKLQRLDSWNIRRRALSDRYDALLRESVTTSDIPADSTPARHLYVIRVAHRDRILDFLRSRGIDAGIHYPVPLHLQAAYRHLGMRRGSLPITERAAAEIVSLPLYPELTDDQANVVAATVLEALSTISSSM